MITFLTELISISNPARINLGIAFFVKSAEQPTEGAMCFLLHISNSDTFTS